MSGYVSDFSGSAPAVGNVLGTIPRNDSRKGAFVQNQSTSDLQVVLDQGAAGTMIIIVGAATAAGGQGGAWDTSGFLHRGRIRICGPSSSQFAAGELL